MLTRRSWSFVVLSALSFVLTGTSAEPQRADPNGDPLPPGALARFGTLRWRTGSPAALTSFLGDGKQLLTITQDHVAQVWDVASGREVRRFDVSAGTVPPRPVAGAAGVLVLNLSPLSGGAVLSADGKTLAVSATRGGNITVWDVTTGKERSRFEVGGTARARQALSADGKTLAVVEPNQTITLHGTADGKALKQLGEGPKAGGASPLSYRLAFSRDGKMLVQGFLDRGVPAAGAVARLTPVLACWDVATGKELRRLTDLPGNNSLALMYSALTPDGYKIALPEQGKIAILDLTNGQTVRSIESNTIERLSNLVFTPDGKTLLSLKAPLGGGPATVTAWDVATGKEVSSKKDGPAAGIVPVNASRALGGNLTIAPDGGLLAWVEGVAVRFLDVKSGKERAFAVGHTAAVNEVTFAPEGKTLTTHATDGSFLCWDAESGRSVPTPASNFIGATIQLAPDGRTVALNRGDGIQLIDVVTGAERQTLKTDGVGRSRVLSFSPDSRLLGSVTVTVGTSEQGVRIFDVATGKAIAAFPLPAPPAPAAGILRIGAPVRRLIFSLDGRYVLADSQPLLVFETATGREHRQLALADDEVPRDAIFSPDGRTVAVETVGGGLALWELASGKRRLMLAETTKPKAGSVLRYDSRAPHSLSFSPNGRLLAQAADDGKARVWDVRTGKELTALDGSQGGLTAATFSPDGRRLATGGADTTALLWDVSGVNPQAVSAALARERLEACWADLADADAARAYEAIRALGGDPHQAVALLRERLAPARAPDKARLGKLIADLDGDEFNVRDQARLDLEKLGDLAASSLREALPTAKSAEVRRQLEGLLGALNARGIAGEQMRVLRALEVLEQVANDDAVKLLQALAAGAPEALLTTAARAVLGRLRS